MTKQFWFNIPVKNLEKSKAFFNAIGFKANTQMPAADNMASYFIGEQNVVMMLCDEMSFRNFSATEPTDTSRSSEVLFSIDAESIKEVDELTAKAVAAGEVSTHTPTDMNGWMYGSLFTDLDGHRWNVLYMDMSKMNG